MNVRITKTIPIEFIQVVKAYRYADFNSILDIFIKRRDIFF